MTVLDREWLEQRAETKKALIVKIEAAIDALSTGAQSYTLDTGQTRQTVTKSQLGELRLQLRQLEDDLAVLDARICGASAHIIPGF